MKESISYQQPSTKRGEAQFHFVWYAMLATSLAESGRADGARRVLDRLAADDFRSVPRNTFWLASIALLANAAARAGATVHAPSLTRLLLPHADRTVVFGVGGAVFGSTRQWLGVLAAAERRWEDSETHLAAAAEASRAMGAAYWLAQAEVDLAGALLGGGSSRGRHGAVALASDAAGYARRQGSRQLLNRAEELLARST